MSSFAFSLRYCKYIANLLFRILWEWQTSHIQSDTMNLQKILVFICSQKVNFIPHVFEAIAKICELLILGTLGMPGYAQPKGYYQIHFLSACQK